MRWSHAGSTVLLPCLDGVLGNGKAALHCNTRDARCPATSLSQVYLANRAHVDHQHLNLAHNTGEPPPSAWAGSVSSQVALPGAGNAGCVCTCTKQQVICSRLRIHAIPHRPLRLASLAGPGSPWMQLGMLLAKALLILRACTDLTRRPLGIQRPSLLLMRINGRQWSSGLESQDDQSCSHTWAPPLHH